MNNIFEPFFKFDTSRNTKWYWLWLSIVQRIIEIFNWNITASVQNNIFKIRVYFK
jgi:hypothetical protein